ncbi:MFS family permease [Providencia alcalifaciens]|nr:MFS family permease [Providencia alcalifaciens]
MSKIIRNKLDIFIVSAVFFLEVLDATIFTPVLIDISNDLKSPIEITTISISSYVFSLALFTPINMIFWGNVSAKNKFMIGMIIFFVASFFCSVSSNIYLLSISRMLQGFGGALVVPIGRTLVLSKTDKENIPIVMTFLIWPALFAPVIGGYITQAYNWKYVFYFILLLSLFILLISSKWLSDDDFYLNDRDRIDLSSYLIWSFLVLSIFSFFALTTMGYLTLSIVSLLASFFFLYVILIKKKQ